MLCAKQIYHSVLKSLHHDAIGQRGGQQGHFFPYSAKELLCFCWLEFHFFKRVGVYGKKEGTFLDGF